MGTNPPDHQSSEGSKERSREFAPSSRTDVLLEDIRHQFKAFGEGLTGVGEGIERLEMKVNRLETKVDRLDLRVVDVESRLGQVESRLGQVEFRLGQVESKMDRLTGEFSSFREAFIDVGKDVKNLQERMSLVEAKL